MACTGTDTCHDVCEKWSGKKTSCPGDAPEAILSIQITEACSTIEPMGNLLEGGSLVVFTNNGLVQVLWIEADKKGTIRLVGISDGRHPFSRQGDRCYHPLSDHVVSICSQYSMGTFLWSCWTGTMFG